MLKWMRRVLLGTTVFIAAVGAYTAAPFWTAWTIREAIKTSDASYLEQKIEWTTVRASLKESLTKLAIDTGSSPLSTTTETPSIWQRFKTYISTSAVDRFIDATVTPTGMAGLLSMRKTYSAALDVDTTRPPVWERVRTVWSRVTRAEFKGFARFEVDMFDKQAPDRTIKCVLELRGFEWKMTELRVTPRPPAG